MLLKMLREPRTGRPSSGARLLVALIVLVTFAVSGGIALMPIMEWIFGLL